MSQLTARRLATQGGYFHGTDRDAVISICQVCASWSALTRRATRTSLIPHSVQSTVEPFRCAFSPFQDGFDNEKWKGGKYGRGQYLSADASRAVSRKYTRDNNMLLLVEAVLGRPWHLQRGEAKHELDARSVREVPLTPWAARSLLLPFRLSPSLTLRLMSCRVATIRSRCPRRPKS